MAADLQIIDGFETLRAEFIAENPGLPPNTSAIPGQHVTDSGERPALKTPDVVQAWICARVGLTGRSSEERQWLRTLVRLATQDAGGAGQVAEAAEGSLSALLRKHPKLIEEARRVAKAARKMEDEDAVVQAPGPGAGPRRDPVVQAKAWAKAIGGLGEIGGLRVWKFMCLLGDEIVVPEHAVRRFLFRLGLLDVEKFSGLADASAFVSAVQALSRLTGMEIAELDRLMAWHSGRVRGLSGGGLCVAKPRCSLCPLAAGCAWFRFRGTDGAMGGASKESASADRLKLRWRDQGLDEMSDAELLTFAMGLGGDSEQVARTADDLIRRFGGLREIDAASLSELTAFRSIGEARARQIKAAFEIGRRLSGKSLVRGDPVNGSEDVWLAFRERYRHIPQEHFIVLLLDTKNRLIKAEIVSKGTLSGSLAHPREVFKQAVRHSASAVILMHNHPSGDPEPSPEDFVVTEQLCEAGRILGIRVLDHVILGESEYFSFKDEGAM